jgi:hypothetical protein
MTRPTLKPAPTHYSFANLLDSWDCVTQATELQTWCVVTALLGLKPVTFAPSLTLAHFGQVFLQYRQAITQTNAIDMSNTKHTILNKDIIILLRHSPC